MAKKPDNTIEPITDGSFDDVVGAVLSDTNVPISTGPVPKAIADGFLEVGNKSLPCAVLMMFTIPEC